MSRVELFEKFPDEDAAARWMEARRWPDGERCCLHCGSAEAVQDVPGSKPMPYEPVAKVDGREVFVCRSCQVPVERPCHTPNRPFRSV